MANDDPNDDTDESPDLNDDDIDAGRFSGIFKEEFVQDLEQVLNKHNIDSITGIPDFILGTHIRGQISMLAIAIDANAQWHA